MPRAIPLLLFIGIQAAAGCSTSSKIQDDESADAASADSTRQYTRAIHVLVDGNDRGTVPMTVQIRRGFGTRRVSLYQAGKEIRIYEFEFSGTTAGDQTLQGFWSTPSAEGASFDVRTLPNDGEMTFFVPYTPYPIKVEDHAYGLTLHVED